MKTLYVNINNNPISPSDELVVMDYDLIGDFFFYLGERIGKGCNIQNENALITDFNTSENKQDYDLILSQWNEIKRLLFGEDVTGSFKFELPSGYLHWLRYNENYNNVYEANFSNGSQNTIPIDLEDLYEDSVEALQRKVLRKLNRDDLYLEIDEIVFNDEAVNQKSRIIRTIKDNYDSIGFIKFEKWNNTQNCSDEAITQNCGDILCQPKSKSIVKNIKSADNGNNSIRNFLIFLWETEFLFIDNNNELILHFPNDTKLDSDAPLGEVDNFSISLGGLYNTSISWYLWKIYEYEYAIFQTQNRPLIGFPLILFDILENELFRANDDGVILYLRAFRLSRFEDEFMNELKSLFINLSRYLRHCFSFNYHGTNKTNTLVSWGITQTYFAYITKTKLLCNKIYKKIAAIDYDNKKIPYIGSNNDAFIVSDGRKQYTLYLSTGTIKPNEFENVPRFQEGLARVLKNGEWGYIDSTGNLVISYQFEDASHFSNGTARVKLHGKYYLINKRGELFEGYVPESKR